MSLISIGTIIDNTLHRYREHFREFMTISMLVLAAFPFFYAAIIIYHTNPYSVAAIFIAASLMILGTAVSIVAGIVSLNGLIFAAQTADGGKRLQTATLVREGRKRFWPALGVAMLIALITLSSLLLLLPGSVLVFFSDVSILIPILGIFLWFVGGIGAAMLCAYLGLTYIFAPYALLLEKRKPVDAIKRAHALVRGRWWPMALRVVLPKLTIMAIFFLASYIILELLKLLFAMLISPEALAAGGLTVALVVMTKVLVVAILRAVMRPLFVVADYYVFDSLSGTGTKNAS